MALFPVSGSTIRGRVIASFPVNVEGDGGIEVIKVNGVWTISPKWEDLDLIDSDSELTNKQVWTYDSATGVYNRVRLPLVYTGSVRFDEAQTLTSEQKEQARENIGAVARPSASTDNAVARYDGIVGGLQNSGVTISDADIIDGLAGIGTKITFDASGNFTELHTDLTSSDYSVWGGNSPWYFAVSESWSPGNGSFAIPFVIQDTMTGGNGSRQALTSRFYTTGSAGVAGEFYQGGDFVGENAGTGSGSYFGIGVYGIARSGAAASTEIVSGEFDTLVATTVQRKIGIQIVDINGSTGSASSASLDCGLQINSDGTGVGYHHAIRIEDAGIKTGGNAFVSPGALIDKAGAVTLSGSGDYGIDFNTSTYTKPIRIKNNTTVVFRNAGGTADVDALGLASNGDAVLFGANFSGTIFTNGTFAPITAASANLGGTSNGWASLLLGGSTSGSLQLKPAAVSGTSVLTFPAGTTDFSATGAGVVKQSSVGGALVVGAVDLANGTFVQNILGSSNGGTGNGFTKFTGPASAEKTFTLPNASATVLTDNAVVTVAQGGTGDSGTAWTTYTPTVGSLSGTITTASASGRYKTIGKSVFIEISVTITTNGTGAGYVSASLPVTSAAAEYLVPGREKAVTGVTLNGAIGVSSSVMAITDYANNYPGADGRVLLMTGVYEGA